MGRGLHGSARAEGFDYIKLHELTKDEIAPCHEVLVGAELMIDVSCSRSAETARSMMAWLAGMGARMSFEKVSDASPAICSNTVRDAIRDACGACGFAHLDLPSGAGHDAMHLAAAGPIGMIFIPCKDGRSHCPEEWTEPDQLAAGAEALYETVLRLDERVG